MNELARHLSSAECDNEADGEAVYPPTWLGIVLRILSVGLILGLVANIVWQIAQDEREIAFKTEIDPETVRPQSGQYLIPVQLTNLGTATARDVKLELDVGGSPIAIEILMIGQNETVTYVVASQRPLETIPLKVISYEAP